MEQRRVKAGVAYVRELVEAGLEGITAARHEMRGGVLSPPPKIAIWSPSGVGAALGMLGARLIGNRKSASRILMGGLAGGALGFGAALAWASRGYAGCAARRSIQLVNATRDAHWLKAHPIDYA